MILEKLPAEYDSRVKAMELDERPTEQYSDIGGLDTQIQEVKWFPAVQHTVLNQGIRSKC